MDDKGEIEFFNFVPIHFVNELESDITNLISSLLNNNKILLDSCKKNMFIFKSFVLRNIIKFPSTFKYERKKTDLVIDTPLDINKYYNNVNKKDLLLCKINNLNKKICALKNKCNNLDKILEYENDMIQASKNIRDIKYKYNNIMEYVSTLPFLEIDEENFNYLLEYREIRSEILKREVDDLRERIDMNIL
ncbi:hypothetical protein NCER_101818 [Vairimorpha ceranae BRL01]|uniref:Uncharacterized protein n=2 Tax=Vairimorpha ceranae TaxID=40302 RepID=C4VAU2_VAIC1|nr:hypothetical protein AAJ76_1200005801 [Vairimorpha ceranae]EEQ81661.1 hypothetical protein NCER_101818 [Vairimorpha ceranae BRL01]KAF5140839.1 hypothetical protein G9O61_00g009860 [Vairimorpha ceranae]KKO74091.1 hypothetical protein AAJ76_1200005801 [Vairimorpha ceranae]